MMYAPDIGNDDCHLSTGYSSVNQHFTLKSSVKDDTLNEDRDKPSTITAAMSRITRF